MAALITLEALDVAKEITLIVGVLAEASKLTVKDMSPQFPGLHACKVCLQNAAMLFSMTPVNLPVVGNLSMWLVPPAVPPAA